MGLVMLVEVIAAGHSRSLEVSSVEVTEFSMFAASAQTQSFRAVAVRQSERGKSLDSSLIPHKLGLHFFAAVAANAWLSTVFTRLHLRRASSVECGGCPDCTKHGIASSRLLIIGHKARSADT